MTTSILITFQLEGIHNFPAAKKLFPNVGFLADFHRHQFHFKLEKIVTHDDRDEEFIMFKRRVSEWLKSKFYSEEYNCLFFDSMSCEMIARELLITFNLKSAEVWEDLENGARIER